MSKDKKALRYCVLVADDDLDDQYLIKEAFAALKFTEEVNAVNNGDELFDYLHKRGRFEGADIPFPKVILLDLNMPRKDGKTCLKELKTNSRFSKIPVIIFSTSNNPQDISQCYELGANSYITKPSSYHYLVEVLESLNRYWFFAVKTPDLHYE